MKFVPQSCLVGEVAEEKYYQYTFIDEYSRFRILKAYKEHSTYSSTQFLKYVVKQFPYAIECIQTDNGSEFTNRLNSKATKKKTLFETTLEELGIRHKLIQPYTPRHNGKVERSHRKDNEEFYACHTFYSFEDFQKQLAVRQSSFILRITLDTTMTAIPSIPLRVFKNSWLSDSDSITTSPCGLSTGRPPKLSSFLSQSL